MNIIVRIPLIGDTVYAVSHDNDRLVSIGTIRDRIQLIDTDPNVWQVWLDERPESFEYLDVTSWYPTLNAWILDVDHAQAFNLI